MLKTKLKKYHFTGGWYYVGVGIISIPITEYELEESFQKSIKNIKSA